VKPSEAAACTAGTVAELLSACKMRASFWPALIQDYWTPSGSCALALSVRQGRITGGMKKEGSIWPIIILEDFLFSFLVGFLRSD